MVKNNIRKSLLEQGLTLSEKFILSSNNQIQEKFLEYLSTVEFKKILLYSPYKNEIKLDLVLKKLNEMQKEIFIPKVFPNNELRFNLLESYNQLIKNKYKLLHHGLIDIFKLISPKIAVLGINPHAGEFGTIGDEELKIIMPSIEELRDEGYDAYGPISADTVFIQNKYDSVLSMYHDQALPVLKTIDFNKTVNISLGLPFLRISVDHGTAEDIASDFKANPSSMIKSIKIALNENKA